MSEDGVTTMSDGKLLLIKSSIALLFAASMALGCTSLKQREYAPLARDLDGMSELEFSTYPAGIAEVGTDRVICQVPFRFFARIGKSRN
jgi:hypothetical protein